MVCVPMEVSASANPVTAYGTMAPASKRQPNAGSCGRRSQGSACQACTCSGSRPSSKLRTMPTSSPASGASSLTRPLAQTLQPTMVAKASAPASNEVPDRGWL